MKIPFRLFDNSLLIILELFTFSNSIPAVRKSPNPVLINLQFLISKYTLELPIATQLSPFKFPFNSKSLIRYGSEYVPEPEHQSLVDAQIQLLFPLL